MTILIMIMIMIMMIIIIFIFYDIQTLLNLGLRTVLYHRAINSFQTILLGSHLEQVGSHGETSQNLLVPIFRVIWIQSFMAI